ncbi:hypothetical protein [Vibrio gigantis]|uniref:GIY-YIG domain-containing protein n=1 Tax=Vibrio gigantis TaxID=296199 RepID=A0A5M9P5X8_9VIBR|nr:hypothetical protein [Vibrio gigantis]KAA8679670.1 hypothetical protein F4W18_05440 [Vibrio gigantis]
MVEKFTDKVRFSEWSNSKVPQVAAGVYAIWEGDKLVYCGMSGREIETKRHKKKYGLVTRLNSHALGRLSGDQFCVYVANQLVIPSLKETDFPKFASGKLTLDMLTKQYIHSKLEYQYVVVDSSKEAYGLENKARIGDVFGQKPMLNPIQS